MFIRAGSNGSAILISKKQMSCQHVAFKESSIDARCTLYTLSFIHSIQIETWLSRLKSGFSGQTNSGEARHNPG
jgi:hypothetical protein